MVYCGGKKQGFEVGETWGWNPVSDNHIIPQILSAYVVPAAVPVRLPQQ